jgi:hypothetical protein
MNDQQPSGDTPPADWAMLAGAPATAESLTALTGADPAAMTGAALVDAIVASEKALSLLAGTQMRLLAALAVPFVAGDPMRLAAVSARKCCLTGDDDPDQVAHYVPAAAASLAAEEVAAALRIPCRTAGLRVAEADRMTGVLEPTLKALEEGVLDRAKARVITDHCRPLDPEQTQDLQDLVLPGAGELSTTELREVTGQAVIIVDPDGAENRHQEAAARRELQLQPQPDGMATLKAHLPADGAVKIFQVSDLLATGTAGTPGDSRGIGARRVDALVDIADHLLTHGFVDLTDYLGAELPDHGTPTARTKTSTSDTADATGTSGTPEATTPATSDTDTPTASTTAPATNGGADVTSTEPTTASATTAPTGASVDTTTAPTGDAVEPGTADGDAVEPGTADGDIVDSETVDRDTEVEATTRVAESAATTDTDIPATAESAIPADTDTDGPDDVFAAEAATESPTDAADDDATPVATVTPGSGADRAGTGATTTNPTTGSTTRRGGNRVFTRQGRRPHLSVTIGLSTLAGLDNLPGSLAGYGAIPAGLARSIAASAATINAVITDPDTGRVTAAGALTYRPTQELRDQIAALQNVCQFPSCRQPVWRCEMDHRDRFDHDNPKLGGKTAPENIGPFVNVITLSNTIPTGEFESTRVGPSSNSPAPPDINTANREGRPPHPHCGSAPPPPQSPNASTTSPAHQPPSYGTPTTNPPRPATSKTYSLPSWSATTSTPKPSKSTTTPKQPGKQSI